ncbi:MAG: hypothetical protein FWF36_07750 [Propionibacteriaceae bacterium]|nr:hypothetical protein [Propionibacteriaceae bacterium]
MSRRQIAARVLYVVAAGFVLLFAALSAHDWHTYLAHPDWSAPYYAYVLWRGITFLTPAFILLIVGVVLDREPKP